MLPLSLDTRAGFYNTQFPDYPPLVYSQGWLYGIWMLGQNYKSVNHFYGEYPSSYLKRIMSLFPDRESVLHLFAGTVIDDKAFTFDIQGNADVLGDAHRLSSYFPDGMFDLILADPPYTGVDSGKYNTPPVNKRKVVSECFKILSPGGYLVWLDTMLPMFRKSEFKLAGTIGVIRSTNHRVRLVSIFQVQK